MTDPNVTNLITQTIGSLGFPIAVTVFLLVKGSKVITDLTKAINDMQMAIQKITDKQQGGQQ